MDTAFALMIGGVAVMVASFVFMIINMTGSTNRPHNDGVFRRHGLGMIAMFLGVITIIVGLALWLSQNLSLL